MTAVDTKYPFSRELSNSKRICTPSATSAPGLSINQHQPGGGHQCGCSCEPWRHRRDRFASPNSAVTPGTTWLHRAQAWMMPAAEVPSATVTVHSARHYSLLLAIGKARRCCSSHERSDGFRRVCRTSDEPKLETNSSSPEQVGDDRCCQAPRTSTLGIREEKFRAETATLKVDQPTKSELHSGNTLLYLPQTARGFCYPQLLR